MPAPLGLAVLPFPEPHDREEEKEQAVRPIRPTAATSRAERTLRIKPRGPKTGDPNPYSRSRWVQVSNCTGRARARFLRDRPQIGLITPCRPVCLRAGPRARARLGTAKWALRALLQENCGSVWTNPPDLALACSQRRGVVGRREGGEQ